MPEVNSTKRILVADDDLMMSNILVNKLKANGFDVGIAENGVEVLKLLTEQEFDLILLDITMPQMDGFDVMEKLQKKKFSKPIIIMSNLGQPEDIKKAKALGAVDYMIKTSVTTADMVKQVQKYLV